MPKELPSPKLLRKLLRYDADTGRLFWRERMPNMFGQSGYGGSTGQCSRWNARHSGAEALTNIDAYGYRAGRIMGQLYKAHRVVWCIETGGQIFGQLDHVNGDRLDNRMCNLRVATSLDNARNAKKSARNKSGSSGVWRNGKVWVAQIGGGKNREYLGSFREKSDAIEARTDAEIRLGYHKNHGRDA